MRNSGIVALVVTGLVTLFIFDMLVGSDRLTLRMLWQSMTAYDLTNPVHVILKELRMPRALSALLLGGLLSFSGYLLQSLVSNPLADPYLLGTASGASLGANMVIFGWVPVTLGGVYLGPIFAFCGALLMTLVVVVLASIKGGVNPFILVIGGVAMMAMVSSVLSLLSFFAETSDEVRSSVFWAMGSLERSSWSDISVLSPVFGVCLILGFGMNKPLALMVLGTDQARYLGTPVAMIRWMIILFVSLATGVAVAVAGPVGFVGLIIPHFTRALFGVTGKQNVPLTMLLGSTFLLLCDAIGRWVLMPSGLPVGVITSIVGVPFFIYLLIKTSYRFQ